MEAATYSNTYNQPNSTSIITANPKNGEFKNCVQYPLNLEQLLEEIARQQAYQITETVKVDNKIQATDSDDILTTSKSQPLSVDLYSNWKIEKYNVLKNTFNDELTKITKKYSISPDVKVSFDSVAKNLCDLPYEKYAIEIIRDSSIKFSLLFDKNRQLNITKRLKLIGDEHEENQILYSYFINKELIYSDVTSLEPFIQGFKEYIIL